MVKIQNQYFGKITIWGYSPTLVMVSGCFLIVNCVNIFLSTNYKIFVTHTFKQWTHIPDSCYSKSRELTGTNLKNEQRHANQQEEGQVGNQEST